MIFWAMKQKTRPIIPQINPQKDIPDEDDKKTEEKIKNKKVWIEKNANKKSLEKAIKATKNRQQIENVKLCKLFYFYFYFFD